MAARQHGAFSRAQAKAFGFNEKLIRRRVGKGVWIQMDHNVLAVNGSPDSWERRLSAAVLSRPEAYVAGRSAAHLHNFPGFPRSRPEILVPFQGNARSPLARVIRSRLFEKVSYVDLAAFRVTTVAETILTLAYREPSSVVERLVDDRLAANRLRIEDFDPILDRLEGARVRGLPALRRIVGSRDHHAYQPPTTELERLLYMVLDDPSIPEYTRQLPIAYPARSATVDAFVPDWHLIAEADGRRWHTRAQDFEIDRARDNAAATAGLITVRFTYSMLTNDPDGCINTLCQAGKWRRTA